MIETGITVEGVPLENHLEDKKRKRFSNQLKMKFERNVIVFIIVVKLNADNDMILVQVKFGIY